MKQLLLIRHGRSALGFPSGLLRFADVVRWQDDYDVAGLAADDEPPRSLLDEVARASVIAASDLPRAVESAWRLARGRPVLGLPIFREFSLVIPRWVPCPLPFTAWGVLVHLHGGLDILGLRHAPPEILERADAAEAWCRDACRDPAAGPGMVAVVTHGVFRKVLAKRLVARGWRTAPGGWNYAHWSVWRFSPPRA